MRRPSLIQICLALWIVGEGWAAAEGPLRSDAEHVATISRSIWVAKLDANSSAPPGRIRDRKDGVAERIRHWRSDWRKKRAAVAEIAVSSTHQQHRQVSAPAAAAPDGSRGPANESSPEESWTPQSLDVPSASSADPVADVQEAARPSPSGEAEPAEANPTTRSSAPPMEREDEWTSTVDPVDSSESAERNMTTEKWVSSVESVAMAVNRTAAEESPASERRSLGGLGTTRPSGRALSHEEEPLPWEAMSTKVIGTIVEDIEPLNKAAAATATALTTGAIAAIVMCLSLTIATMAGLSAYWWYRKRYVNRPETLSERYAPSETGAASGGGGSSNAGDDVFRVGYIHSPEMPRDSSEEMYSLDNDSFLTSLEAMTIPTYWTETIKHTKL